MSSNPWIAFRQEYKGMGYTMTQLSSMYHGQKGGDFEIKRFQDTFINASKKLNNKKPYELTVRTGIVVPTTKDTDIVISKDEFDARVSLVKAKLAQMFGGFSATHAEGGFWSDTKGALVNEPVVIVESYANSKSFEDHVDEFVAFISKLRSDWSQDEMGVIIEDDLYYI